MRWNLPILRRKGRRADAPTRPAGRTGRPLRRAGGIRRRHRQQARSGSTKRSPAAVRACSKPASAGRSRSAKPAGAYSTASRAASPNSTISRRCTPIFAGDPLIAKLRKLVEDLRELGAGVAADDLDTRIKTALDQAPRLARDRRELVSPTTAIPCVSGNTAFTVSRQPLDITLVQKGDTLAYHLTGTDHYQTVQHPQLDDSRRFWKQSFVSETDNLARVLNTWPAVFCKRHCRIRANHPARIAGLMPGKPGQSVGTHRTRAPLAAAATARGIRKVHDEDAACACSARSSPCRAKPGCWPGADGTGTGLALLAARRFCRRTRVAATPRLGSDCHANPIQGQRRTRTPGS